MLPVASMLHDLAGLLAGGTLGPAPLAVGGLAVLLHLAVAWAVFRGRAGLHFGGIGGEGWGDEGHNQEGEKELLHCFGCRTLVSSFFLIIAY